jgi:hypothetical protein
MFRPLVFPIFVLTSVIHFGFSPCSLASPSTSTAEPNVVDLGYVRYRGNLSFPDTVAYLGIPYAEPPLGDRRFRNPLPLNTTRISQGAGGKIVDASVYPDFCVQGTTGGKLLWIDFFLQHDTVLTSMTYVIYRWRCGRCW